MTDQLPDTVNYLLLALLYLFFGRILWAVWSEVRTPAAPRGGGIFTPADTPAAEKGALSFVVVEPRQHRGARHVLSSTLAIGRDDTCDIVVSDDAYISGRHARIEVRADGVWLVDLNSTNGTFLNGNRLTADRLVRRGDRIQVGSTVLEVRQ
jgi:pSer/pThr/pTyr-binding forkhead associated (FHA) protein